MFLIIVTVFFVLGNASSNDSEPVNTYLRKKDSGLNLEACDIGDVVENDCSRCICTSRHLFDCTPKGCPKTNDSNENQTNIKNRSCHPHKIYNMDGTICICNPDGRWPHKSCHSIFRSLPSTNIIKQKCIPDSYVVIDCNICRCNDKGQIDNERCTKNECDNLSKGSKHRRNSKGEQVYGKCNAKYWYSFAPCQFCYCLKNNKLMCNTGAENRDSVKLGSYKFSVCGTELLKEALELIPDGKEAINVLRIGKHAKDKTTTETADKSRISVIDLEMGENNNNDDGDDDGDDDDSDKVEKQNIRVETTKSQIENTESKDFSESEDGSDKEEEKFTQHPYEDSDKREKDTDNGGGRTEDRDDKNDENNSEDASKESLPLKLPKKERSENKPVKASEEHESEGSISIKFDMNDAKKELTKKEKKSGKLAGKKEAKDKETVGFDLGNAIKNNLPMIFSKVLSNLRKTVSLDSATDCEPGTRLVVKCNVCHCLKNKKMICTNNKCE